MAVCLHRVVTREDFHLTDTFTWTLWYLMLTLWCKINLLFPLKHGFSSKIYISHITELKPLCISLFSFALILYQIPFNEVNVIIVLKSASFNLWLVSQSITSIHVVNSVIINLHNHLLKHPHVNLYVIIVFFFFFLPFMPYDMLPRC